MMCSTISAVWLSHAGPLEATITRQPYSCVGLSVFSFLQVSCVCKCEHVYQCVEVVVHGVAMYQCVEVVVCGVAVCQCVEVVVHGMPMYQCVEVVVYECGVAVYQCEVGCTKYKCEVVAAPECVHVCA